MSMARDIFLAMSAESDMRIHACSYRRKNGEIISTYAAEERRDDLTGDYESVAIEERREFELLIEDVGRPVRGDVVIISATEQYTVQSIQEGGDVDLVRVTVK